MLLKRTLLFIKFEMLATEHEIIKYEEILQSRRIYYKLNQLKDAFVENVAVDNIFKNT